MDLSNDEVERFLTELFESTKGDEDANIGQFGVGFAQMLAKAKTTVYTRRFIVEFDARQRSEWSSSPTSTTDCGHPTRSPRMTIS